MLPTPATVTIQLIQTADDADQAQRLAALDDAPPLAGDVLLAVVDGDAVAALSLQDGRAVANPFVRTAAALELLRLRAQHVRPASLHSPHGLWHRVLPHPRRGWPGRAGPDGGRARPRVAVFR